MGHKWQIKSERELRRKSQLVEEVERHEKYVPRTVHIVVIQILQQEELSLNK